MCFCLANAHTCIQIQQLIRIECFKGFMNEFRCDEWMKLQSQLVECAIIADLTILKIIKNTHEKQKQTLKNWLIEGYRNNNNKIIQKSKRT